MGLRIGNGTQFHILLLTASKNTRQRATSRFNESSSGAMVSNSFERTNLFTSFLSLLNVQENAQETAVASYVALARKVRIRLRPITQYL
jgi:hypothetical protein